MDKKDFLNNLFKYYDLTLKIDNILGSSFKSEDIGLYQKKDPENIDENGKFNFSSDSNYYQYGIAFNLLNEKPFGINFKLIPSFVVLFPNYDEEFKMLTPDIIFIEIKRFLGYKLTEEEKEFTCEIKPYLIFNSKILEPYNLETPSIKLSNYVQIKKEIAEFLKPILESKTYKHIDFELQNKPFIIGVSQNLNMGLTKIYQSIFENKSINELNSSYFTTHIRKKDELILSEIDLNDVITRDKVVLSYSKHYGSFDINYPLANT